MTTIHAAPRPENSRTTCCGKMPAELPDSDRLSAQPELVTCTERDDRRAFGDWLNDAYLDEKCKVEEQRKLLGTAASVAAALRAVIDDTDLDSDDHDGRFGHLPYPTYAEAKRILARWDRANTEQLAQARGDA